MKKKERLPKIDKQALLKPANIKRASLSVVVLGLALLAGMLSFAGARRLAHSWDQITGMNAPNIASADGGTTLMNAEGTPVTILSNPNMAQSVPELEPWDGAGRVTVLIVGLDYRDWSQDENGASRSDTMILLTMDPLSKTAGILSIPRDMWVAIPGFQHAKINTAYYLGESYKLPGGGPGLAIDTVEQFLGVPINFYAQVDFDAFVKFIDEIGGIKVDVPEKIKIDLLGDGNKTIKTLKPGVQTLPGDWALAYARNRYTEGGDFDRARRQQQVIMGIRDRIMSVDMLPTLIAKAPELYSQLADGVHTNLTLDQVIKLAVAAREIPEENIKKGVFDQKYGIFGESPDGLSIVIPIPDKIHTLRDEIFATSGALGPQTQGDAQQRMQAEGASVAIYNGSTQADLAGRSQTYLQQQGLNVIQVGDAGQRYGATTIIDHTGSPYTLRYLVDLMGIHESRIWIEPDLTSPVDVELFLGDDWAVSGVMP